MASSKFRIAQDDETEDEEVKLNCIGGLRAYGDSDFSDSEPDEGSNEKGKADSENGLDRESGVVKFSGKNIQQDPRGVSLIKPKAERVSPHLSEACEDERPRYEEIHVEHVDQISAASHLPQSKVEIPTNHYEYGQAFVDEDSEDEGFGYQLNKPSILPLQSDLQRHVKPQTSLTGGSKTKRVLSSNTLIALNTEVGHKEESPKRMRVSSSTMLDNLPELSLGLAALDAQSSTSLTQDNRIFSPVSENEDEELDTSLMEELRRSRNRPGGDKSPVPLLTPPQSPLSLPESVSDLVEWPSNLVIDSALMSAAIETRPLSPCSLQQLEKEEVQRLKAACERPKTSNLTPLLRSICVSID